MTHSQSLTAPPLFVELQLVPAVGTMGVVDSIVRLAVTLRLYLHLLWLAANREARTSLLPPRKRGRLFKKVLLLGDGNTFGVGDWVTMGSAAGPARELQRLVDADDKVGARHLVAQALVECARVSVRWRQSLTRDCACACVACVIRSAPSGLLYRLATTARHPRSGRLNTLTRCVRLLVPACPSNCCGA